VKKSSNEGITFATRSVKAMTEAYESLLDKALHKGIKRL